MARGQSLFNDERFFEAHEAWEELWHFERGRDRIFIQGLIQVAGHMVHIQKGRWSGALSLGQLAKDKLTIPPAQRTYIELDILPLLAAVDYNLALVLKAEKTEHLEAYMIPKLLEK